MKRLESENAWRRLHRKSHLIRWVMAMQNNVLIAHVLTMPADCLINSFTHNGFYLKKFRSGNCISIRLEASILCNRQNLHITFFARKGDFSFLLLFLFLVFLLSKPERTRTHERVHLPGNGCLFCFFQVILFDREFQSIHSWDGVGEVIRRKQRVKNLKISCWNCVKK